MRFIGFCFFLFISLYGFAQHEIEGQVSDEKGEALTGVTVLLLSENDSTMIGFGITNPDGKFRIENVEKGEYLLQFSFVSYHTTIIEVKSDWTDTTIDVGQHTMLVESELLAEVTVEAERIPLGVKGDTITYNTAAFRTRPGATVEDLLKQLPGIEVGRDGSIKAQGEEVENVLVDGKEFFGKDPKIATQNLEAEAVENVEVFDKASEMAEFTGIDDGNEEKTINLELKEDYKTGGFGRVALAAGSKDRREGKLQYNRFSTQMQASTILSSNNINKQPFSFNEYMQMMGGLANAISNTNGLMNFGEIGGDNQTQGLTDNLTAGLNFNYDFTDKLSLKSHYFYINKQDDLMRDTDTKSFIDGLEYESIGQEVRNNIGQNHRLTSKLLYKSTPLFQILLKNNLLGILKDNVSNSSSQFVSESSITSNQSNTILDNNQFGYQGQMQIRKKFLTKGRNWINDVKYSTTSESQQDDVLNEFLLVNSSSTMNQLQEYSNQEIDFSLNSVYTEPLGGKKYLSLGYEYSLNNESPERLFFDQLTTPPTLDESVSTAFDKEVSRHVGKLGMRFNGNKLKTLATVDYQWTNLINRVNGTESFESQSSHILPSLTVDYEISSFQNIGLRYSTTVNIPTLSQLSPIVDNTNPNLQISGNPNLIPEYEHRVTFNLSSYDNFSLVNFYIYGSLSQMKDKIINEVQVDENFLRTIRPINSDDFISANISTSFSAPIRPLKIKYRLGFDYRHNEYSTFLNNALSGVSEDGISLQATIENRKKSVLDIKGGIRFDISKRRYGLNSEFNQNFSNYSLFLDSYATIKGGWSIGSKIDFNQFSNEFFADAQSFLLWNAEVRKSFKNDLWAITLIAHDILAQNQGIERNGGLNSLRETRFNTLTRYVTLGVSYKLGKKGA